MKTYLIKVDPNKLEPGNRSTRLDLAIVQADLGLSRRRIRAIIDAGGVYVNKHRIRVASREVSAGDEIRVEYSEDSLKTLKHARLVFTPADIIYDDYDIIAVNKPPGMPSQATKDQSIMHVVTCLQALDKELNKPKLPYVLVHRLDKETSGIILVAKNNERATWLMDLFRERKMAKTYLAVCHGLPQEKEFTVRCHLSDIDKRTGDVKPVRSGGRLSVTHFKVLLVNESLGLSLVECHPETGRSHQIRVHLDMSGLPIVGDKRYGVKQRRPLPSEATELKELASVHHFLHAARLRFAPALDVPEMTLRATLPERMAKFMMQTELMPTWVEV